MEKLSNNFIHSLSQSLNNLFLIFIKKVEVSMSKISWTQRFINN